LHFPTKLQSRTDAAGDDCQAGWGHLWRENMKNILARTAVIATLGLSVAACAATVPVTPQRPVPPIAQVSISHVEGSVTYRERILMPAGSILSVSVQDISRADAPAETIAGDTYTLDGSGPPYDYRLRVFNDRVNPNHTYAVRAEIRDPDGRLAFTTDTRHEVLTRGAPNQTDLVLVRVSQGS
jgi:putative lipoprotein